ncbi:MAG: shufflon system plasmid conjugative transfer pilus tip adhesin PilV [Desulfovibrio sp.]|nr:shufflon system plasmid conjugative transfer pilus tip adhesin PilV [Desulfovibrio sp.]
MHLLESLLSLGLIMGMLSGLASLYQAGRERALEETLALELRSAAALSLAYAEGHMEALYEAAGEEDGPVFSGAPGIPEAFRPLLPGDVSGKNSLGQHYELHVRKKTLPGAGKALLLLLLTRGGTPLSGKSVHGVLNHISRMLPLRTDLLFEQAGFLTEGGRMRTRHGEVDLPAMGIAAEAGRLAFLITIPDPESWARLYGSEMLYRRKIVEMPELNRMETALSMGRNPIVAVSAVGFSGMEEGMCGEEEAGTLAFLQKDGRKGLHLCLERNGGFFWTAVADGRKPILESIATISSGDTVAKPSCPGGVPDYFLSPLSGSGEGILRGVLLGEDEDSWRIGLSENGYLLSTGLGRCRVLTLCRPEPSGN